MRQANMQSRLILGNAATQLETLDDGTIDLTVTSPPYDNMRTYGGYVTEWSEKIWKPVIRHLYRATSQGGVVVWIVADATTGGSESGTSMRQALYARECGFNLNDTMIWAKHSFTSVGDLQRRYAQTWEYMFVFSKGAPRTFNPIKDRPNKSAMSRIRGTQRHRDGSLKPLWSRGKTIKPRGYRFNVWHYHTESTGHPAPFPRRLAYDHILSWSNEGDTVLDPFAGYGTTGIAAMLALRHFVGIEINPQYLEEARRRINKAKNSAPMARLFEAR